MAKPSNASPSESDIEFVAAIILDANRDARRVSLFLNALGLSGTPQKPLALPPNFLLHLGAALHLWEWECQGFFYHADDGLPDARTAIDEAIQSVTDADLKPQYDAVELSKAVMLLSLRQFAWSGRADLDATIALDGLNEDACLQAIAEFLYSALRNKSEQATGEEF